MEFVFVHDISQASPNFTVFHASVTPGCCVNISARVAAATPQGRAYNKVPKDPMGSYG